MPAGETAVLFGPSSRSKSELTMQASARHPHRSRAIRTAALSGADRDGVRTRVEDESLPTSVVELSMAAWRRKYLALKRFQSVVRSVIVAIRWMKSVVNRYDVANSRVALALKPYEVDALNAADLAFDMAQFRARKDIELSAELKQILQLQPQQRRPDQVRALTRGLQRLPTFNEYPLRVQEKLARVARYHTVPPGRVIIRQGHAGVNFYVIISGKALVHVMQQQRDTIVARLGQGQAFGEVALMQEVTRTASIVSQDAMQLLAIGRDEFQEIFSNPEQSASSAGNGGMPDPLRYLLSCSFMRHFPPEPLLSNAGACRAGCFRRNAVIVADSKTCPDLVLIRSGFCRVMKRLVVNRSDSPRQAAIDSSNKAAQSESAGSSARTWKSAASSSTMDGESAQLPTVLQPSIGPSYAKIDTGLTKPKRHQFKFDYSKKRSLGLESLSADSFELPPIKPEALTRLKPPPTLELRRPVPTLIVTTDDGRLDYSVDVGETEEVQVTTGLADIEGVNGRIDDDKKCVAVEICILKPGDVFGLSDIMFKDEKIHEVEDSASVSLVSNGAECILLSKAFFVQHAPEQVRRRVREAIQPYPSERVFEQNYYTQVAWNRYRRTVFKLALSRALATGAKRRGAKNTASTTASSTISSNRSSVRK